MRAKTSGNDKEFVVDAADHNTRHMPGGADVIPQLRFFNGTFIEPIDAFATSDGATITMTLEQTGGGDLTMNFSDGQTPLDCTPACTVELTPGTDEEPVQNFVYILQSTKALTVATDDWPAASVEHIRVCHLVLPSASLVNTGAPGNNFVYGIENINDEASNLSGQGHLSHIMDWARHRGAQWHSGTEGVATQDGGGNDLWVSIAEGEVAQIHHHLFAELDSDPAGANDPILVINDPDAAYTIIHSLNSITKLSNGDDIGVNKYVQFVVLGIASKTGAVSLMMLNLPSGEYNSVAGAVRDVEGFANSTIPREYFLEAPTGFLVAAFVCKHTASAMIIEQTIDLRGSMPFTTTTGGTGGGNVNADAVLANNAIVRGDGGAKGVQTSSVTINDAGSLAGASSIIVGDVIITSNIVAASPVAGVDLELHASIGGLKVVSVSIFKANLGIETDTIDDIGATGVTVDSVLLKDGQVGLLDTDASHHLLLDAGSDLSADRVLSLVTGDAARTLTLVGNPTLGDWFDQSVKAAGSPTFQAVTIAGNLIHLFDADTKLAFAPNGISLEAGGVSGIELNVDLVKINKASADLDFSVNGTVTRDLLYCDAGNNTVTIGGNLSVALFNVSGNMSIKDEITFFSGPTIVSLDGGTLKLDAADLIDLIAPTTRITGELQHEGSAVGFYGVSTIARPNVTGARDEPEGALGELLKKLEALGLITDSTTAS